MSANHSLVLFEGDVTSILPEVFECFELYTTGNIETAKGLAEIWEYTNWPRRNRPKNVVHKGILFNGTWTGVLDREMNMILDQDKCEVCAHRFQIKIFGYMIESVSGTCALYLYAPEKVRGLNIQNFEILEDFGEPLPQENGISTEEMLEDGTMRVARRMGFSDALFAHSEAKIQIVGMEDPSRTRTLERSLTTSAPPKTVRETVPAGKIAQLEKPWWKIW